MFWWILYAVATSLIPVATWWATFKMPLGRRLLRQSIVIDAPVDAVWRRLDPRNLDFGWHPNWEIRNAEIIDADPLMVEYSCSSIESPGAFIRVVNTYFCSTRRSLSNSA